MENQIVSLYGDGKSIRKISEITGFSYHNVRKLLFEHNLLRTRKEAARIKETKDHKFSKRIIDRYLSGEPFYKIRKSLNVGFYTIKSVLDKNGIPYRTRSDANAIRYQRTFTLSEKMLEIINGELLGDGCIDKGIRQSRFVFVNKQKEYADWLAKIFIDNGIHLCGSGVTSYRTFHKYRKKYYKGYKFSTLSYTNFHSLEKKWYNDRIKKVPQDINISPSLVLHWYLGDGSLINRKYIIMCTNCFNYEELLLLSNKLNQKVGIKSSVIQSNGFVIFVPKSSVPVFLNYIGLCPVDSMNYKWNIM